MNFASFALYWEFTLHISYIHLLKFLHYISKITQIETFYLAHTEKTNPSASQQKLEDTLNKYLLKRELIEEKTNTY